MSSKPTFQKRWFRYFIKRDPISKMMIAAFLALAGILYFTGMNPTTLGVLAGFFLVTVVVSLCSYVFVGRLRENAEYRFYDEIYYDCGFQNSYKGREMNRIVVHWKGVTPTQITVFGNSGSNLSTSKGTWRNVKLAVIDSFNIKNAQLVTNFSRHSQGQIDFAVVKTSAMENDPQVQQAVFIESMHAFAYERLGSYGTPLPRFEKLEVGTDPKDNPVLRDAVLTFETEPTSYEREKFEAGFRRNYDNPWFLWNFEWSYSSVVIKRMQRGGVEDKQSQAYRSIKDLMRAAGSGELLLTIDDDFVVPAESIEWVASTQAPDAVVVDFMQSDISRDDRVERFEKRVRAGLVQLFKGTQWEFTWDVDAYGKSVKICRVN